MATITQTDPSAKRSDPVQRRVRHDIADGATLMVFSFIASVVIAGVLAVVLSVIGGRW